MSSNSMSAAQQKAPTVCVSASDAHDWSAHSPARRSPSGKDGWIHDSFCNEEKKKKGESACERRNSQDHWEIIRRSGVVDLELNGIINQAKKQARCSYIYYLHVFHFRRCNKQIYIRAPDLCHRDLEAENPFWPLTLKARSGISSAQWFFCFPHRLSSPHNALCLQSNLHNKQNKPHRIMLFSPCPLN